MIGEDDDPAGFGWQLYLFQVGGRQRRPYRQARTRHHHGKACLDTLAQTKRGGGVDRRQANSAACDLAQHHARLGDGGLRHGARRIRIGLQVGSMNGQSLPGTVADDTDHSGKSGFGFPMGEVMMCEQIGSAIEGEPATAQIVRRWGTGEYNRPLHNEGDLACGVALRFYGSGRFATLRWVGRPTGGLCGIGEQRAAGEVLRLLQRTERPTALTTIEVVPVASVFALQCDDARAAFARGIASDIGHAPFVTDAATVGKMSWRPLLCGRAQASDDCIEVVMGLRRE